MYRVFLFVCALIVSGCFSQAQERALFNGKNLDGWYTFLKVRGKNVDPQGVFTITNGLLKISGEEWGCITTEQEFSNYKLVLEFKWGGKNCPPRESRARDSGLLVHSQGEDGAYSGTWMRSIEANIIEGGMGDFVVVGDKTEKFQLTAKIASEKCKKCGVWDPNGMPYTIQSGRINWYGRDPEWEDVLGFRGKNDLDNPLGEWNCMELIASGDKLDVFYNGKLVNQAYNVRPTAGKIQIQSEAAEIFFRKIAITPLK